jgi:hypothetical protein
MDVSGQRRMAGFSTTASKGYALVSAWEKCTVLSASQLSAIALLRGCGDIHEPEQLVDDTVQAHASLTDIPNDTAVQGNDGERKRVLPDF